ncbi:hypothetical protein R1flu_028804 [Riccia fluitans]|uniref:carbonic anhydrase n=1 Tax=Riccia fluitans TaxID=41844 RepID=A0ABD1XQL9_9MARC
MGGTGEIEMHECRPNRDVSSRAFALEFILPVCLHVQEEEKGPERQMKRRRVRCGITIKARPEIMWQKSIARLCFPTADHSFGDVGDAGEIRRLQRLQPGSGDTVVKMAAQQIVESALLASASSFFRGDALSGRAQAKTASAAVLAKPVAGVRSESFSPSRLGGQTLRNTKVHAHELGRTLDYGITEPKKVDSGGDGSADVISKLKEGFVKFKNEKLLVEKDVFEPLKTGQTPKVMFIACGDSRVCPTLICGLNAGDAFIIRNVANLVPPEEKSDAFPGTSAALLFAVNYLKVEHVIVCGHSGCGGIRALMSRNDDELEGDWIGNWICAVKPAKKRTLVSMEGKSFEDQCKYCEQEAVNESLSNLLSYPFIKDKFEAGTLGLHGWYYDFVDAELTSWEVKSPALVSA